LYEGFTKMVLIKRASILAVMLAILLAFYILFGLYAKFSSDLHRYMDLNIGDTRDETLYARGVPTVVEDPPKFDASFGGNISRTYQVDGKDNKNRIPAGKSYKDYLSWSFDNASGGRIDLEFDAHSMRISSIGCYSQSKTDCPQIFGISTGMSEDDVLRILGKPTTESLDGTVKRLEYDDIGLNVYLSKRFSYYIVKRSPNEDGFPWSRFLSLNSL
jgi:hypothetical protein